MFHMNILHLRYAIEVEKSRSITKAADKLHMNQPHLSKAIKELEETMGFDIFNRTSKGVFPTKTGSEFLVSGRSILSQIDEMEYSFKPENRNRAIFNIGVPRASYISNAFCSVVKTVPTQYSIDINYRETSLMNIVEGVCDNEFSMGIIRFPVIDKKHYLNLVHSRGLKSDLIWEFSYKVVMSAHHDLAKHTNIPLSKLKPYIQITHGDLDDTTRLNTTDNNTPYPKKQISVYERGSQLELLHSMTQTYMFVSPLPHDVLTRFNLVEIDCDLCENLYTDLFICKEGYLLNELDTSFINHIRNTISKL